MEKFRGRVMDLANMRENGARSITVYCACGHYADVNVDAYPGHLPVPEMRRFFRCSLCGERARSSRPNSLELGVKQR